jgi:pimeloyl-ACP methyl ester carboxylesterase
MKVFAASILISLLIGFGNVVAQSSMRQPIDPAVAALGQGFVTGTAKVNGAILHYVRGGQGPSVLLIHGFPEDWYEFHLVMPRLAKKFTVVAPDLRGVGGSSVISGGFDAANMAKDIYQLARLLKLGRVYVAGHDIGGLVAYAFLRRYPKAARGVMILDVPLAGIAPWEKVKADPNLWHISFHQTPELPEKLIAGRQLVYFRKQFFGRHALNRKAMSDYAATHYANAYGRPEQLRAGLEFYRAFPANERFNATRRSALEVPIVLAGGDHAFGKLIPQVAEDLGRHGCMRVTIEVIKRSGHYVADEQPEVVAELIERYASLSGPSDHEVSLQPADPKRFMAR